MGSRIRENPDKIFELFAEIARPTDPSQEPFVLQKFPDDYNDEEILNSIPKFAFPCEAESTAVDHFTFVQTDIESKFKFGFCRHGTGAYTCLCIVSVLPWYEIFYRLLNELGEILNRSEDNHVGSLLTALYAQEVGTPGEEVVVVTSNLRERFTFITPDPLALPTIPENRNLTEYYNAVDTSNMMIIFASMLFERRILVTSKKLSRMTACLHGSASLIYPMHWQHLYIPVLPPHLLDYCSAPMPFLIGIHSTLMEKVRQKQELGDAVILDTDNNTVTTEYDDLASLPPEIVSSLKKKLKGLQAEKMKSVLGDGVARAFLRTLVSLIGGYRDALKFRPGEQITFDSEAFIQSRPSSMQPFLEKMLHLQIFEQFINDRLDLLNSGMGFTDEFEREANSWADKTGSQSKYNQWLITAKRQGRKLRREGKDRWVEFTSRVKDRSKKAYKDLRSKIDELKKEEDGFEGPGISRTRPTTIDSPQLRTVRPRRPPALDTRTHSLQAESPRAKRTSYEKAMGDEVRPRDSLRLDFHAIPRRPPPPKHRPVSRARQYKMLDFEDGTHESRVTRRTSSQDDSDLGADLAYSRVSVDLMNDADIQQVFKKSYSLEDLARLTAEDEEGGANGIEQGRDVLVAFYDEQRSSNVSLGTDSVSGPDSGASSDRSKPPTPLMRRPRPLTPSSQQSSDRDSPRLTTGVEVPRPQPPPRKRNRDSLSAQPLIRLDVMGSDSDRSSEGALQQRQSSSASSLGQDDDTVRFYPKYPEFDPLESALTDGVSFHGDQGVMLGVRSEEVLTGESDGVLVDEDNNNPLLKPRNRNSIIRQNAFYNIQRPPSVKRRPSPTPQATDAQTIKDARTAFIQSELVKPTQAPISTSLDFFDPLLTGQLVMDMAPSQSLTGSGLGSGSSLDTYCSQGTAMSDTVVQPSQEENLLKEWNLDFSRMRITSHKVAPPVPPKPTMLQQDMRTSYQVTTVPVAPSVGHQPNYRGGVGGTSGGLPQAGPNFYQSQPTNFNATPRGFVAPPNARPAQPSLGSNLGSVAAYTTPNQTVQPPMLKPRRPVTRAVDNNVNLTSNNPFGDLDLLAGQPAGSQVRPTSFPVAQPRNSWETFE